MREQCGLKSEFPSLVVGWDEKNITVSITGPQILRKCSFVGLGWVHDNIRLMCKKAKGGGGGGTFPKKNAGRETSAYHLILGPLILGIPTPRPAPGTLP